MPIIQEEKERMQGKIINESEYKDQGKWYVVEW